MRGKIESGQLCTVEPVVPATLKVGDIVLCKVNGKPYLHLVKAIQGKRFQIGNNRGRINGEGRREQHLRQMHQSRVRLHERHGPFNRLITLHGEDDALEGCRA